MKTVKKIICMCGHESDEQLGTVEFKNGGDDVVEVNQFPHVRCSHCNQVIFNFKVARILEVALNHAKNKELSSVNYQDFIFH